MQNVHDFISQTIDDYEHHEIELADGCMWNQYDELQTIEHLITGHFENGDKDPETELPKPFFDIISRIRLNQSSSEDINIVDLGLKADTPKYYTHSWLLSKFNRVWLRRNQMNDVLDDATQTRGDYGGVLLKVTEDEDDLYIDVINWHHIITDPNDIEGGVKIELLNFTPAQLLEEAKNREWDEDAVQDAIMTAENTVDEENSDDKRTLGKYVFVTELHGVFPVSMYKDAIGEEYDEEDENKYAEYIFITANSNKTRKGTGPDGKESKDNLGTILFAAEKNDDSPTYYYLPYEVMKTRALGRGTVEKSKHAQWWTNKAVKNEQDAMEYAGRVFLQAPTGNKAAKKNVLTQMKNGTVLEYTPGNPIQPLSLSPAGLGHFQNLVEKWNVQIERSNFTYAANTGENLPSGTPFRQAAMLNSEAGKPAGVRRDQMGELWKRIYRERVIKFLVRQAKKEKVLATELTIDELRVLDEKISVWRATNIVVDKMLSGYYDRFPAQTRWLEIENEHKTIMGETKRELADLGDTRWFGGFPEGFWDGVEDHVIPDVSNTDRVKSAYLETLSHILNTVQQSFNPQTGQFMVLEDPTLRMIFEEIMETAGYSPLNLELAAKKRKASPEADPQQQMIQQEQVQRPNVPDQIVEPAEQPAITDKNLRQ